MKTQRLDVTDDVATVYNDLFFARDDDDQGILHGKDAGLCATYRDWYRGANPQKLQISYDQPTSGTSIGYFLRNPTPTKRTAIVIHGITSSWKNTGPWVRVFYDLGFNILTPNLRGHGDNEQFSKDRNMGIYDSKDMISWVRRIMEPDVVGSDAEIVIMGYSLGASVALQAISYTDKLPSNVRAAVEDSGFPSLPEMVAADIARDGVTDLNTGIAVYAQVNAMLDSKQGVHIEDGISPASITAGKVPLLVIYGDQDTAVYPVNSQFIYSTYSGSPKAVYEVPDATHPNCIAYGYSNYRDHVRAFLVTAKMLDSNTGDGGGGGGGGWHHGQDGGP